MKTYIIRRLLQALGVCLVISALSFFLLFLNTDPALVLLPPDAEIEDIEHFKKQMGLDRPVVVQYLDFLQKIVLHGDFGKSFVTQAPVTRELAARIPNTLQLALCALLFANIVAIIVGIYSAVRRYSAVDNLSTFLALMGQAMPNYWFGIMLIIIFGVWLHWFPISGAGTWQHLVLPTITLGTGMLPINLRLVRSGMLDVLNQDYIRTARAKGLKESKVLIKHAFKNAAIPGDNRFRHAAGGSFGRLGDHRNRVCLARSGPAGGGVHPHGRLPGGSGGGGHVRPAGGVRKSFGRHHKRFHRPQNQAELNG